MTSNHSFFYSHVEDYYLHIYNTATVKIFNEDIKIKDILDLMYVRTHTIKNDDNFIKTKSKN